jgi:hypothetical protein
MFARAALKAITGLFATPCGCASAKFDQQEARDKLDAQTEEKTA